MKPKKNEADGGSASGRLPFCFVCLLCAVISFFALACCTGCAESNTRGNSAQPASSSIEKNTDSAARLVWFYFDSAGNLIRTESPSQIPSVPFVPWTEAIAVLDAGLVGGEPVLLVNKRGLVSADSVRSAADADASGDALFPSAGKLAAGTAISLAREAGKTYVRFYRNSVFAGNATQPVAMLACGDAPDFPLQEAAVAADFGVSRDAQFVSLNYTGNTAEPWAAAFKSTSGAGGGTSFEYAALSALPVSGGFSSREISAGDFQSLSEAVAKLALPSPFSEFVGYIPAGSDYTLKISGELFPATVTFASSRGTTALAGCGFLAAGVAAALFSDGTLYLSKDGARTKTLRLPALNAGYLYTSVIADGDTVLAAWEERRFFETGRSGLLLLSLNQNSSGEN